jgi:hypothetical protein
MNKIDNKLGIQFCEGQKLVGDQIGKLWERNTSKAPHKSKPEK